MGEQLPGGDRSLVAGVSEPVPRLPVSPISKVCCFTPRLLGGGGRTSDVPVVGSFVRLLYLVP